MFNMTIKLNPCENIYTLFIPVHLPNIFEIKKTTMSDTWRISAGPRHSPTPPARAGSAATRNPGCSWPPVPPDPTTNVWHLSKTSKHPWNMLKLIEIRKVSQCVVTENQLFQSICDNFLMYLWVAQAWQILKSVRQLCSSLAFSGSRTLASVSRASKAQLSGFRMISTWCKAIECYGAKEKLAKVTPNRNRNQL